LCRIERRDLWHSPRADATPSTPHAVPNPAALKPLTAKILAEHKRNRRLFLGRPFTVCDLGGTWSRQ
jgi:hypothetical protein